KGEPRMRQNETGLGSNESSEVQDVDIDFARSIRERRCAAHGPLDFLNRPEQRLRSTLPENLYGRIPELRLIGVADRIGKIETRDAPEIRDFLDFGERRLKEGAPVAQIATQPQPDAAGLRTLLPPRVPSLRSRPLRRARPLLRPLLQPDPLRRIRSSARPG